MKCLKFLFLYKRTLKVKCHSALRLKSPTPIGPKEDDELNETFPEREWNEIYANEQLPSVIYQLVISED